MRKADARMCDYCDFSSDFDHLPTYQTSILLKYKIGILVCLLASAVSLVAKEKTVKTVIRTWQLPSPTAIADTVQHVWVVPDSQKGIQEVQALLEELGVRGDITQETENSCDLTVQLNKMQLVQLVRSLAEGTGELVSNAAPQPEQKLFAGVGETMVTYHIKLLKN